MPNNRIFYPVHMVAIKDNDGNFTFSQGDEVHGVESMSMTTNFTTEQTNELGTQTIYANVEGVPEVEVSLSKVLDGYPTPYLLSTIATTAPTMIARSAVRCTIGGVVYPDTNTNASGDPESAVVISGAYVDSVSYNFSTDGNFSEDTTFVGNDKLWYNSFTGDLTNVVPAYGDEALLKPGDFPTVTFSAKMALVDAPLATQGIATSQGFDWTNNDAGGTPDSNGAVNNADTTVFPSEIAGITASGTNEVDVSGIYGAHISSMSASVSFSREDIFELGTRRPFFRPAAFPVEVTSEFAATAGQGDLVSALGDGIFGTGVGCDATNNNTRDRTIRVVLCEGLRLYLGVKNRIQSVGYSGGDADGGNVSISYSYTNFNDFTVMHETDPEYDFVNGGVTGIFKWADRTGYLQEA